MRRYAAIFFLFLLARLLGAGELDLDRLSGHVIPSGDTGTQAIYHGKSGVLELSTRFRQDGSKRACWDLPITEDLSHSAGIRLRIRAQNADLASQLDIYLKTDGVWHRAELTPRTNGLWEEVVISKASFSPESQRTPSWKRCDTMRISAWRGASGQFAIQLASIELLDANCSLALVRGAGSPGSTDAQRNESLRHARNLGESLVNGGILPAVVDEPDLSLSALKYYGCIALPFGEFLGENGINQLCAYVRQGGRVAAFYSIPARLSNTMQLPAGKFLRTASLSHGISGIRTQGGAFFKQSAQALMAVSSRPAEGLKYRAWWIDAAGRQTQYPAIIQSPSGFWMTYVYQKQDEEHSIPVLAAFLEDQAPGLRRNAAATLVKRTRFAIANAGAGEHLTARTHLARAIERAKTEDYPGVFSSVLAANGALADESMPAKESPVAIVGGNEFRGVWMRSPRGIRNEGWGKTLRRLKLARYNAVFPHFLAPYATAWPSAYTRQRLDGKADDSVAECVAAATNLGIQVHAWAHVLGVADAPPATLKQWESEGRLQRKSNGTVIPWLCPTQRENRLLMVQMVTEIVRKYDLAGIQLDMLRFEGSTGCYCDRCRAAFARYVNHPLADWPQCTREPSQEKASWEAFRIRQITQLAQELSNAARRARPKIKVSAAVYPDLNTARTNVGQDWLDWLQKGIVDFVCPMDYRPSAAMLQGDIGRQRALAGSLAAKIYPGLGVTVHNLSRQELQRQIQAVRSAGLEGYVLFEYTAPVADLLAQ